MTDSHTEAIFTRICNIEWKRLEQTSDLAFNSKLLLVGEFIRREALWGKALDIPQTIRVPFDIAKYKEPTIRANPEILNKLHSHLDNFRTLSTSFNKYAQDICEWALHWAALKDNNIPNITEYPDPYEPILYMFDNFDTFILTHEGISVGFCIPHYNWLRYVDKPPFWLEKEGFNTSLLYQDKGS